MTTAGADVVFSIDESGSMSWNDPTNLRHNASNNFIDQMDPTSDQAGAVQWASTVIGTIPLTTNFQDVKDFINTGPASGGTNLDVGLNAAIDLLDAGRAGVQKIIIFLCDGEGSYTFSGNVGSPADLAASKGYRIFSVGLGSGVDEAPMIDMANATGGQYYFASDADSLDPIFNEIFSAINIAANDLVVTDVIPSYLGIVGTPTIAPESTTTNPDGTTTLVWNVGTLNIGETWSVSYDILSSAAGLLPTNVEGLSRVEYLDTAGALQVLELPVPFVSFNEDSVDGVVDAAVGMQETGVPLTAALMGLVMLVGGMVLAKR